MTQEYTPDTDDAINLIVAGMGRVTQLGVAPVGYPRTATDAVEAAKRWLAAHDAQIRAEAIKEALSFSISEQKSFVKSMLKVLESYGCFDQIYDSWEDVYENALGGDVNGQYGFDAVEAGIKAVNKLRESDTKENRQ